MNIDVIVVSIVHIAAVIKFFGHLLLDLPFNCEDKNGKKNWPKEQAHFIVGLMKLVTFSGLLCLHCDKLL